MMGLWTRQHEGRDPHRLDPSLGQGHYLAPRYTQRLPEAGAVAVASVGPTGDNYDTLAEAPNSLVEVELVRNKGRQLLDFE